MTDEARELMLYIENDSQLHHSQEVPITKNLATKMAKGVYSADKAIKLWMYLMDAGAKKYAKENGSPSTAWNVMFPKTARLEAAKAFNETFLTEYGLGNYSHLLPKKYQKKPAAGGKARHAPRRAKVVRKPAKKKRLSITAILKQYRRRA